MATYTELASAYIPEKTGGIKPVSDDYTIWMTEALQLIINASPTDMLWLFETDEADTGEDGVDIGTNKILYVLRESNSNLINSTYGLSTITDTTPATSGGSWEASKNHYDVVQLSTSGTGTGAKFAIITDSSGDIEVVVITSGGRNYKENQTITIEDPGTNLADPTPTITLTIASTIASASTEKMLVECREVPAALRGRLTPGSGWMEEVSETDPVFYKLGKKIYVLPSSASANTKVYWIKNPPTSTNGTAMTGGSAYLDATSGIPSEVEPMVLAWCIYKGVATTITKLLTEQRDFDDNFHASESAINSALDKANSVLEECEVVNNKIGGEIDSSKNLLSDVDSVMQNALGELDEAIVDTDSSGDFATAITNMKNSLAEYGTTFKSGGKVDGVQGAIQNAQGLIDGSLPATEFNAFSLIEAEELDILQGVIQTAGAELQRAQSYLAEWQAASGTLGAEIQGFASEVQTRSAFVQAKSVVWQGSVAVAQGYLAEIQSNLGVAQAYGTETQSKLAVVQGYTNESAARLSLIASKVSEKQINQAILAAVYGEMMACQNKYLMEFTQGLQMLHAGTYKLQAKDDIKKLPTYTGIAE